MTDTAKSFLSFSFYFFFSLLILLKQTKKKRSFSDGTRKKEVGIEWKMKRSRPGGRVEGSEMTALADYI